MAKQKLVPTVTIGGAPASYKPATTLQPTVTIGGAPSDYKEQVTPNYITGEGIPNAPGYTQPNVPNYITGAGVPDVPVVNKTPAGPSSEMQDAYQRLYDEFNAIGLGALVADSKDLLMKATSVAAIPDALRNTAAYKTRFSANDARIKAGLAALSPAQYLAKEDAYQNIMRNYGLPASYYTVGQYGKQEGFDKLLANDVSAVELEDRVSTAQNRVMNANPEVLAAIKSFYPEITNGEILAYALDPSKGLADIKKKVTAAEIQGAANAFGLNKITA